MQARHGIVYIVYYTLKWFAKLVDYMQHIVNHQTQLPGHCIWHVAKKVHMVALEFLLENYFSCAEID